MLKYPISLTGREIMISTSVLSFREADKKGLWPERAVEYPQLCQSGECQGARSWNVDSEGTV